MRALCFFGGQDRFYRSEGKFKGSDPEHILSDVRMAIQAYLERRDSPVEAVCMFYQLLVKAHPFYDANGRIARLFASSLLRMHGLEIRWDEMEGKNNEFIRRLNQVHKHPTSPRPYLGYLTSHIRKFTHPIAASDEAYD